MTDNPFAKRLNTHSIGRSGRSSEKLVAKDLGGRSTPASGAMEGAKGDIDLPTYLLEAKSTVGHSIGIKHEWLAKIAHEARNVGKNPAITLSFTHGNGRAVPDGEWVAIPMWLFKEKCL